MRIALPVGPATLARRVAAVLGLAVCAALGACGASPAPGSHAAGASALAQLKALGARHPRAAHATAKPAAPGSADLVAAVAGERSAVPVQVRFAVRDRPEVGKPVELDIEVIPTGPLGRLVTSFHAEDGLDIERGAGASATDRPEPGVPLARALTIVARRDGIFYVDATVLVDVGADSVARTFTIPVIAGAGAS
ncbi:MAG: hypothetical protein ACREUT_01920 [Steroidobacteraceae bacterium]